jgi:hypothetical protein
MITLYLLSAYRERQIRYQAGEVITVDEVTALRLERDAPSCFSRFPPVPPEPTAISERITKPARVTRKAKP